jgi:hypothetical protein
MRFHASFDRSQDAKVLAIHGPQYGRIKLHANDVYAYKQLPLGDVATNGLSDKKWKRKWKMIRRLLTAESMLDGWKD